VSAASRAALRVRPLNLLLRLFGVGAGQTVSADQRVPSTATLFTIQVQGGGTLGEAAQIALHAPDETHYLAAAANDTLDASGSSVGAAQTFKLGY
jgi:hypothetical protein